MMALKKDMIGIAMTNASALVAPTFSIERNARDKPLSLWQFRLENSLHSLPILLLQLQRMANSKFCREKIKMHHRMGAG
jgi:LDH2 family malate/lactate/ureidoglycolate dehydrogenase